MNKGRDTSIFVLPTALLVTYAILMGFSAGHLLTAILDQFTNWLWWCTRMGACS